MSRFPTIEALNAYEADRAYNLHWVNNSELLYERQKGSSPSHIEMRNVETGATTRIAGGSMLTVSQDRKRIAFKRSDRCVIYDLESGVENVLPNFLGERSMYELTCSPDMQQIAVLSRFHSHETASPLGEEIRADGVRVIDVGVRVEKLPRMHSDVTWYDIKSDTSKSVTITGSCRGLTWTPQGTLLVRSYRHCDYEEADLHTNIFEIDPRSGTVTPAVTVQGLMQSLAPRVSPSGKYLAYATDSDNNVWIDFPSLHVLDRKTGETKRLTHTLYVLNYIWLPDETGLIVQARHGGFSQLHHVDLDGTATLLTDGARAYFNPQISPNGQRLACGTNDLYGRRDIRILPFPMTTGTPTVFSIDDPTTVFDLPKAEQITYETTDGLRMYGFLVKPTNFDEGRTYPALVDVHGGGPGSSLSLMGMVTANLLERFAFAGLGYVVCSADYRSSGEYGAHVGRDMYERRDWLGYDKDWQDIESAGKYLAKLPYVDASRIALLGHSAGGVRVRRTVIESSLFRAAASLDGNPSGVFADIVYPTGTQLAGSKPSNKMIRAFVGSLMENPEAYARSFLLDAWKVTTPTFLMSGNPDLGAFPPLSNELFFGCLREQGIPTRFLIYPDEGHNCRLPAALDLFHEIERWFEEHLSLKDMPLLAASTP